MKIAIIPARGGSQRIKNKNIADFLGKPMIAYALEAAKDSGLFDKIHVSTDSDTIVSIVEGLGYKVDFKRPQELADSQTGIVPVLKWVIERYAKDGQNYEDICCIMPAAPLLEPEDLKEAYEIYQQHNKKYPLLVVAKMPVPVEWAFRREKNGILTPAMPEALQIRSQDLQKAYYEAGPFSYFNRSYLLRERPSADKKFLSFVIPQERAVDIDDMEDLQLAETLYRGRLKQRNEMLNDEKTCNHSG